MDISNTPDLGHKQLYARSPVEFPEKCSHQESVEPLLPKLSKDEMYGNLDHFTSYHTRYYKSDYGKQSSDWLYDRIGEIISEAGADKTVSVNKFQHDWPQTSTIVTIPGRTNSTVVIGAHQDSINLWFPSMLPAPGADDDGSGTVTILEVLRVLLQDENIAGGKAQNTIEFHWYSAEEGGLLGSQAVFSQYEKEGRDVKAMLQQDMTGFTQKTIDAGEEVSVGVIIDYVDPGLTDFIKTAIDTVRPIPCPTSFQLGRKERLTLGSTATSRTSRPSAGTPARTTRRRPRRATPRPLSSSPSSASRARTSTARATPSTRSTLTTCCSTRA